MEKENVKIFVRVDRNGVKDVYTNLREDVEIDVKVVPYDHMTNYEKLDSDIEMESKFRKIY